MYVRTHTLTCLCVFSLSYIQNMHMCICTRAHAHVLMLFYRFLVSCMYKIHTYVYIHISNMMGYDGN